jgi:hypothetical protein
VEEEEEEEVEEEEEEEVEEEEVEEEDYQNSLESLSAYLYSFPLDWEIQYYSCYLNRLYIIYYRW